MKLTLKNGNVLEFEASVSCFDVAKSISEGLAREAVAAKVNGEEKDLSFILNEDAEITFLTVKDEEGLQALAGADAVCGAHAL